MSLAHKNREPSEVNQAGYYWYSNWSLSAYKKALDVNDENFDDNFSRISAIVSKPKLLMHKKKF